MGKVKLPADTTKLENLILDGICYDGGHHKQYYLVQIAKELGVDVDFEHDEGVPA